MAIEQWLAVPGHPNYEVSSEGRVRSLPRARTRGGVLTPWPQKRGGYPMVKIGRRSTTIHSLVAAAFIGPRPEGQQVRHLNSDPLDCRASNLAYGTQSENEGDKPPRIECGNGHPWTPENTRLRSREGRVVRDCIACQNIRNANRPKGYWKKESA